MYNTWQKYTANKNVLEMLVLGQYCFLVSFTFPYIFHPLYYLPLAVNTKRHPFLTCDVLKSYCPFLKSGEYWIYNKPNNDYYLTYCDMETDESGIPLKHYFFVETNWYYHSPEVYLEPYQTSIIKLTAKLLLALSYLFLQKAQS